MKRAFLLLLVAMSLGSVLAYTETLHVPEDYPTIQAAIDAAQSGDVVHVAAGRYIENLEITKSLTVLGTGDENTQIQGGIRIASSGSGAEVSVRIEEVTITEAHDGIEAWGGTHVRLTNVTISRHESYGIKLSGSAEAEIYNCTISDNLYGVGLSGSAHATVTDSTVSGNKRDGIALRGSSQVATTHCVFTGNAPGLDLRDSAKATVIDCTISDNVYGISLWNWARAEISRCAISLNVPGIKLYGSSEATITDCTISSFGIELSGSSQAEVTGCTIVQGNAGIQLDDISRATVTACTISERSSGIWLNDTSRASVTTCVISKNGTGIRLDDASQVTTSECVVSENEYGIRIYESSGASIVDTTLSGNEWDGVVLSGSSRAEIRGNTIQGNTGYGVSSSSNGEIRGDGNTMTGNGIDLRGNVPGTLRLPLAEATEREIVYPDSRYASLQAAVDALLPGGRLNLGAGEYEAGVTIGRQVRIEADQDAVVLLRARNDENPVLSLVGGARAELVGLEIAGGDEGIRLGATAEAEITGCSILKNDDGIVLTGSSHAEISDCTIRGSWNNGIMLSDSATAEISDCSLSWSGNGVALSDHGQATVIGCSILASKRDGIVLSGSAQAEISCCAIYGNARYGIAAYRTDDGIEISGSGNVVPGPDGAAGNDEGSAYPAYPGEPWPDKFMVDQLAQGLGIGSGDSLGCGLTVLRDATAEREIDEGYSGIVPAFADLSVDEGFESGDLQAWGWSTGWLSGEWTVTHRRAHSSGSSVMAGNAFDVHPDLPGTYPSTPEADTPSRLWIQLQVREGYVTFHAKVKRGSTLWFTVCEPRSEHMWYSGSDCITTKILAAPGWQEVEVWVPSGFWHFQWENRSRWNDSIWIDDITFAETSESLQTEKKRADELFQEGTTEAINDEHDAAVELLTAALDVYRDIGNLRGEARCLEVLGRAYSQHGYPYEAVELYRQSLTLHQSFFDKPGMTKSLTRDGVARLQYALGSAYVRLGAYDQAIEHLNQSLAVWSTMLEGNPTTDMIADLLSDASGQNATCLRLLATAYLWVGEREQALVYLEMALEIFKRIHSINGEVACLLGLADYSLGEGEYSQALDYAQEAMNLAEPLNDRLLEATCLRVLGLCNEELSQHEKAIGYYEQALGTSQSIGDRDGVLEAQWWLGRTHWKAGQLDHAKLLYEEAIAVLEESRSGIDEEGFRESFFSKFRPLYEEYLDLVLETGEEEGAVLVVERCRARTFLDLVAAGPIGTLSNVAEEGIRSGVVEASLIESDLAEVVAALPRSTAALEYFVTEDATYLWVIRDGSASDPIRIEISRSDLREQVLAFRTTIETTSTGMLDAPIPAEGMEAMSRDLYGLLIAPVEDQLEGIDHLLIVSSGPLYYLPFCALMDCPDCEGPDLLGGEYLIERFSLSYTPSLTTLKYAWASAGDVRADPLFLALADPDSGDPVFRRLPRAQSEARVVAGLFDPSELYVDTEATEDVMTARASEADQILLSTHGSFNPHNPMFSYLLLSPTDDNDGRLYTHEVFSLDLHTDLVTLSACETLLPALQEMEGDVRAVRGLPAEEDLKLSEELLASLTAGDEIVGLTRAFIYAGTPSVLSSLWRVVSETTEQLMVAFYGYLAGGLDKADALQRAQRDVMASYPHPRYWAAFSLMGDWRSACDLACQTGGKLSFPLVEAVEDWIKEGAPVRAPMVSVLVTLREGVSEATTQAIASVSDAIQFEGGFGRFVQLIIPLAELVALSRLSEVEQITVPPAMSTTP